MVDDFEPMDTEEMENAIKNGDVRPVGKSHNAMTELVNTIVAQKPAEEPETVVVSGTEGTSRARVVGNGKFELGGHVYKVITDEVSVDEVVETLNKITDAAVEAMVGELKGAGHVALVA